MIVYASAAVSADGYIDDTSSERLILSGAEDWEEVRALRAGCDGVLIGAETVRRDNPALVTKDEHLRRMRTARGQSPDPVKITVSRKGDLAPGARFFSEGAGQKIVIVGAGAPEVCIERLGRVATVIQSPSQDLSAREIVECLAAENLHSLFIEGGSRILTLFLTENQVDHLRLAVAPFFVGESQAPRFVNAGKFPFNKNRRMFLAGVRQLGDVAVLDYALKTGKEDHLRMEQALEQARKCPKSDTAYSVGAVIVTRSGRVFTGYSRETAPNNHAEEEAVLKALQAGEALAGATIYSTMEPCTARKSKPLSCSALIIRHKMRRVVFAAYEPANFADCRGEQLLSRAGIEVDVMDSLRDEALAVNAHILNR